MRKTGFDFEPQLSFRISQDTWTSQARNFWISSGPNSPNDINNRAFYNFGKFVRLAKAPK